MKIKLFLLIVGCLIPSMSNAMDSRKKQRLNTTTLNTTTKENYSILRKRKIDKEPNNEIELRATNTIKRLRIITNAGEGSPCSEVLEHTVETLNRKNQFIHELMRRNKGLNLIIGKRQKSVVYSAQSII